MKRLFLPLTSAILMLCSCASEYNSVYKSTDNNYKYEFAKECFANGQYGKASSILTDLVNYQKGSENAQECLYMMAMSEFGNKDYEVSSEIFRKYLSSYPRGVYAEMAAFYFGEALYQSTPEARLDQSRTYTSITAFQNFLDVYHDSELKERAQERLYELQDKLVRKELYSALLYYNLGSYFGNCTNGGSNYEAAVITAQNAIKDYPYSSMREDFYLIIMKSKFGLARQSVAAKRSERYRDAEDECYGFLNEFPESKNKELAEHYISICKKHAKGELVEDDY